MFARTYNINSTQKIDRAVLTLATIAVLLLSACTSNSVLEEIEEIDINGTDPLIYTCLTSDNEQINNSTRANSGSQPLTTDFLVSTYKLYNLGNQQTVMHNYHVEYKTSGTAWDGTIRPYWDYTKVAGQHERYWDLSAFPYRFHAIAPCPANPNSYKLDDRQVNIPTPYKMQTSINGMVTPRNSEAEPHLLAQVQRNTTGKDYDLLSLKDDKEFNTASTTKTRYVSLPFHHLNSKIRFGIYSTFPWTTSNKLYIKDLTIKATSSNFVTQAEGYNATAATPDNTWYIGTGNSGFTSLTKATAPTTELLHFDGGPEIQDNDLREHQGRSSAYWLQCPDGIMQIPQENVQMSISFSLYTDDNQPFKTFTDVPIRLRTDGTDQPLFTWKSGYIYTYYLILEGVDDKLEITFTATLTPWEDITGSLTTDLEQ